MTLHNRFTYYIACILILTTFVITAYFTSPTRVRAQEPTSTPECFFDSAGNWVCISFINDLTITPTETDWYTESPTAPPTSTNTRRPTSTPSITPDTVNTATLTPIQLTPFVPTNTPTVTPSETSTVEIQPWYRRQFLPIIRTS